MSEGSTSTMGQGLLSYAEIRSKIVSRFDSGTAAAYDQWVRWMEDVGIGANALEVGDRAPEFLLPDTEGRLVSSASLLEKGPLILTFIRGGWCPFCSVELVGYEDRIGAIRDCGGQVAAITPEAGGYPRAMRKELGLDAVTMLSDIDYGLGLAFGLIYTVPEIGRETLAKHGIDLPKRHGSSAWILPVPATYLVSQDGIIRHAFVKPDFTRREEPQVMIDKLCEVLKATS